MIMFRLKKMMTDFIIDAGNKAIGKIPLPFRKTQITVLRKIEYKGCPVYILQFYNCFMRFFVFQGEAYQNHVFMKPANPVKYGLYMLGLAKYPYGKDEIEGAEGAILNEAMSAIDVLTKAGSLKKVINNYGKEKNKNSGAGSGKTDR